MEIGLIIQIGLFILLALGIVIIVVGALNAVLPGRKGKAFRFSKRGDEWITRYDPKKKSKAY